MNTKDRAVCRDAVALSAEEPAPRMAAWLDAAWGGLAVQFGLPNVVQACAAPVVVSMKVLRQDGAGPLADAVEATKRNR